MRWKILNNLLYPNVIKYSAAKAVCTGATIGTTITNAGQTGIVHQEFCQNFLFLQSS